MINTLARWYILCSVATTSSLIFTMDPEVKVVKFQEVTTHPTQVVRGKLLIHYLSYDDGQFPSPEFTDTSIQYCTKKLRKDYVKTSEFNNLPANVTFVLMKIVPTAKPNASLYSLLPTTQLISLNSGSKFCFSSSQCTFDLICDKNEELPLKEIYFPQDEKNLPVNFKTQFLMCMNEFYLSPKIGPEISNTQASRPDSDI